ncbi:MAG: lysophospholipid acyltransferase family protein [bacterium]|nr:lysophospholipid acyltransferase family protein [bacterium]
MRKSFLLICNHISYIDVLLMGVALGRRRIRFMAKEELFRIRFLRGWMLAVGAFPVIREGADAKALGSARKFLEDGQIVCLFPQGTTLHDPETVEKISPGVGMLSLRCKPRPEVLPAGLAIEWRRKELLMPKKVVSNFGWVLDPDEFGRDIERFNDQALIALQDALAPAVRRLHSLMA